MADTARQFMDALQEMDRERTVEPVLPLFSDDAVLERGSQQTAYRGEEGIRRFWEEYLESTSELETTFNLVLRDEQGAALEWRSRGKTGAGRPLDYRGVSILELRDGRISAFRTYYDPTPFVQ